MYVHIIAALLLIGRLGDILSTRLVSPTLRLEANALVRRLGWRFAWATLLVALVPYYSVALGIAALAVSLMVTASNLSRGWIYHALGEAGTEELLLRIAREGRLRTALAFLFTGAAFVVVAGAVLMWLSGSSGTASFWFGVGIVVYGIAIALHGTTFVVRLFRRAALGVPGA